MFVRNLLQAGDHVTIIPAGVRITLQYDTNGRVEKVYTGFNENERVLHSELLVPLLTSNEIPSHVPVKNGTTFVYGCLYTSEIVKVEGRLDEDVESVYLSTYLENKSLFHFFAGHMHSLALSISSPVTVQRWLKTSGFEILPSYLVPATLREDNFSSMIQLDNYPFIFPRIMGYIRFRSNQNDFLSTGLRQVVVKSIEKEVSPEGYILANIKSYNSTSNTVSYADIINRNVHEDSVVLFNEDNQIVHVHNYPGAKLKEYGRTITCEYCGKVIDVPSTSTRFTCSNEHCVSVMYSRASRMLSKLGLSSVNIVDLKKFAQGFNNIVSLPDVLDMDMYEGILKEVPLPTVLDAVVPSAIITRYSDWNVFCNSCNNSVESVKYYVKNPGRILKDLGLDPAIYRRLTAWLEDIDNQLDVVGVLEHPRISVLTTGKRFEGAPIFRGKSIYLTGKFSHGSFEDVKAILTSYSAEVYEKFNTGVDCVIIGGLHEGVSGRDLQRAKSMDIPIFEEDDFFDRYEIDEDIALSMKS